MSGNSFGKLFVVTTFGESHGPAIGGIVDGCPPGLELDEQDLQADLDRRKPGQSRHTTQRRESDRVQILSGVFEGRTTGTPIGLDHPQRGPALQRLLGDRGQVSARPRGLQLRDEVRRAGLPGRRPLLGPGDRHPGRRRRESPRSTCATGSASGCAGYLSQLGPFRPADSTGEQVEQNPFFCPDAAAVPELEAYMDALRKEGDSVGRGGDGGGRRRSAGARRARSSTAWTRTSHTR